jgi:transposase
MFYAIDIEDRIRSDHPLRPIRRIVDEILADLGPLLAACYSELGRPSVPPEVLLKALLLQCLYSVRSERQLVERLDTDLLFRWFCGLDPAEPVFDATAFTHNRPRLDAHGVTGAFFAAVRERAIRAGLASEEHFSVDGTLIESHASIKSFRPIEEDDRNNDDEQDGNTFKSRNAEVDFRDAKPSNRTHRSRTDPEARFYRKSRGHESRLCHMGHAICENRHGLVMAVEVSEANGRAECAATIEMIDQLTNAGVRPGTLGADRGYDSGPWMVALESRGVTPHTAMRSGPVGGAKNTSMRHVKNRPLIAARRRMKHRIRGEPYRMSQRARKKVEEIFGWCKTVAGIGRARHVGRWKIRQQFEMAAAAYNLVRLRNLMGT